MTQTVPARCRVTRPTELLAPRLDELNHIPALVLSTAEPRIWSGRPASPGARLWKPFGPTLAKDLPMRSLIFATQGVGDVIMAYPLIRAVTAYQQDAALVVTKSRYEGEIARLGRVGKGRMRTVGLRELGATSASRFVRLLARLRAHRPETSAMAHGVDPLRGGILSRLSGATIRVGPAAPRTARLFTHHLPGDESGRSLFHKTDYACWAAAQLGRMTDASVRASMPRDEIAQLSRPLLGTDDGPWIGLAVGSGWAERHKRLPVERTCSLIHVLSERLPDVRIALLGGETERDLNSQLVSVAGFRGVNLTLRTSPRQLLAVLHRCAVAIATCNGVSHMAAAAGCPVVGLFGPTNPALTGPFAVPLQVISNHLACAPCYRRGFITGCGDPVCMQLDVERIVSAVERFLRERTPPHRGDAPAARYFRPHVAPSGGASPFLATRSATLTR